MADDDFANRLAQTYADMHSAGDLRNRLAGDPSIPPPTPYRDAIDSALSLNRDIPHFDPIQAAMGLLGPNARGAGALASNVARMARAKEMGFEPGYYQGRETPYPGRRQVQYITDSPGAASMFADSSLARKGVDGGHVLPLSVNREGFADLTSEADLNRIAEHMARTLTNARPAHYEPYTTADARRMLDEGITNGRAHWQNDTIINAARDAGFPGIPVHENWAQWGWPDAHSLAVFDRSRLRSPNAAFDPANRNSEDLLASLTGAAALPGLALLGRSTDGEPQQ